MSMNSFHARTARPKSKVAVRAAAQVRDMRTGIRADALLVQRGLAPSRAVAQRLIESGRVWLRTTPGGEAAAKVGAGETAISKAACLLHAAAELLVTPSDDSE